MKQPEGSKVKGKEDMVCRLRKSLWTQTGMSAVVQENQLFHEGSWLQDGELDYLCVHQEVRFCYFITVGLSLIHI